ncbi:MAG: 50S ribosomal protein L32 [Actinomycetota bacterium]
MPLPKRKHSHARTTSRRSANWKIKIPNVADCPRCHAPRLPHHVCLACGFYGNRMVLDVRDRRSGAQAEAGDAAQE